MAFASNTHRFSITAFAIAAVATAALNGTMLIGFNPVASAGEQVRMPTVALQPVVISARRA